MNKKIKLEIEKSFIAPPPMRKHRFVHSLPRQSISTKTFVFNQIRFIKKSVWILSAMILLPAVMGTYLVGEDTIWVVSAFIPFLALILITESIKSPIYNMNELEMTTRFSLQSVILARLSILGVFNLAIFFLLVLICCFANSISLLQTGTYLFVPYLLTTNLCLYITRHFHSKEVVYMCLSATVIVSGGSTILHYVADFLFQTNYLAVWAIVMLILLGTITKEFYQMIKNTEGIIWNCTLTD